MSTAAFRKLLYLANYRGMKETELLLGEFIKSNAAWLQQNPTRISQIAIFMQEPDPDIMNWLTGKSQLPVDRAFDAKSEAVERLASYWSQRAKIPLTNQND